MAAELIVQVDESLELAADRADALLQLTRALLHGEPPDPEGDDLQIGEQRVRRRGDHVALRAVRGEVHFAFLLAQHDVVVHGFRGDVHQGKVDRPIGGRDITRDRVDVTPNLLQERAPLRASLVASRAGERGPRFVRKLRIDGHDASGVADHRVDSRSVAIGVLDLVRRRGQRVVQQPLQEQLAETAAGLRRAQQVLERPDVLRELADPLALLGKRAELA